MVYGGGDCFWFGQKNFHSVNNFAWENCGSQNVSRKNDVSKKLYNIKFEIQNFASKLFGQKCWRKKCQDEQIFYPNFVDQKVLVRKFWS